MKRASKFFFVFLLITLVSLSLVSAGLWNNFWNKFTGKATDNFCKDSDAGDIYQKGFINSNQGNFTDTCAIKKSSSYYPKTECSGEDCYVIEYICSGSSPDVNFLFCENGCANGACIKKSQTINCKESDKGLDYYQKGTACIGDNCKTDYCYFGNTLIEYYIEEDDSFDGICNLDTDIFYKKHDCDYKCEDGACVSKTENQTQTCSETDKGLDYYKKGTACIDDNCKTDYCSSNYSVVEYYIENNDSNDGICDLDTDIFSHVHYCGSLGCQNGACISKTENQTQTCIDTDGGINYYKKGTATVYQNGNLLRKFTDHCFSDGEFPNGLFESYCNGSNLDVKRFNCENGCEDGACIQGGENENVSLKVIVKDGNSNLLGGGAAVTLYFKDSPDMIYYINLTDENSSVFFNIPPGQYWIYYRGSKRWDGENCPFNLSASDNLIMILRIFEGLEAENICSYNIYNISSCVSRYNACGDTICHSYWPTNEGNSVNVYGTLISSCSIFEVANPDLDKYVIEAEDFCSLDNSIEYSKSIYQGLNNEQKFKKCKGIFLIEGLGKRAEFMQGYFTPTACCNKNPFICDDPQYFGQCNSGKDPIEKFNSFAQDLKCDPNIKNSAWISDDEASLNYCNTVPFPAHVALNILKTGACEEYSIALTTLLRKAGYSKDEVMSVNGIYHMFNYVKFPGDNKYYFVDTVGNEEDWSKNWATSYDFHKKIALGGKRSFVVNSKLNYDHCIMPIKVCYNDVGEVPCPDNSDIYQCENVPEKHKFNLDNCVVYDWWGHKTCSECWYEFKALDDIEGCCVLRGKILGIPWKKTSCESGDIFDYA